LAERLHATQALLDDDPDAILPVTRSIIDRGRHYSALDACRAQYELAQLKREADVAFRSIDVLLLPTTGTIYEKAAVAADPFRLNANLGLYTDLRKFLDTSVPSTSSHGSPAGTIYRAGKAGAQAMAQSERIKASSAANRFQAVSHASMMSPRLGNTELASQWLRR
jgi:Asp-tRNA(Asn)/Glu-tRNA(Gln) amidotransferase A subunit family amidase